MTFKLPQLPIFRSFSDDQDLYANTFWGQWANAIHRAALEHNYLSVSASASELDGGLSKILLSVGPTDSYKVRDIYLLGNGTNFGAGGNRNLAIQDSTGTVIYTVIPNATLESIAAGRWGSTQVPFPATSAHLDTATEKGKNLVAKYSGGTTDHSTGSINLIISLQKVS